VSHSKIRSEKICLNCGTETTGRYCPACGQENIEPKQTVWHLVTHFFSDITHFDGKFFLTVKDLFIKPGFLSREYIQGRRVSYLDPIRMYIFTSAIFFLIFFSMVNVKNINFGNETRKEIAPDSTLHELLSKAKNAKDSADILKIKKLINAIPKDIDSTPTHVHTKFDPEKSEYASVAAYDSAENTLPAVKRDKWLKRRIKIKTIELNQRYKNEKGNLFRELISNYIHNCPKVLFISLPLFALLLKLLYVRRKQFFYVDHGIFSLHLYIFSFLILLILFGIGELKTDTGWGWLNWIFAAIVIYMFIYYYKAMRRFYGQGRAKTILKYILLFILSFIVQFTIFTAAIIFTVFEA
jgi:hypothetical protein